MRRALLPAVLCVAALGGAASPATEPPSVIQEILSGLDARPISCPEEVEQALDPGQAVHCASLEERSSKFRKSWQRFVTEREDLGLVDVSRWDLAGKGWIRRNYRAAGVPLAVAFSENNSGLMLTYGVPMPMCPNPTAEELGLPFAGTEGIPIPQYATPAKVMMGVPHGGAARVTVRLKVKIDKTGEPSVLCVLRAEPEGYRVEESAIQSVEENRYEPPMRDGEPTDVAITVEYSW